MNELIPEFPVHIATIYPHIEINKSFKIDYLSLSSSLEKAIFLELKTDDSSRRQKQDDYLNAAKEKGLSRLLEGLREIFRATSSKYKYYYLLKKLAKVGMLNIPEKMDNLFDSKNLDGINKLSYEIEITCKVRDVHIIYLQPSGTGPDIISFNEFRATVDKYNDPFSKRFAQSLFQWSQFNAGHFT